MITTKEKKDSFVIAGSEIKEDLLKIFNQNDRIFIADIGSCDGLSTIIYSRLFPNAFFYVFEPILTNVKQICGNFKDYDFHDRAVVYPYALGNKEGELPFFVSKGQAPGIEGWETGNKSSSLLAPSRHLAEHKWCKFEKGSAKVKTLDSLGIEKIDFAHIDVQGAEMLVLSGGKKTFKTTKAIWIEVANIELYAGQPMKNTISIYLNNQGMKCVKDTCGKDKSGDMLWIRK